MIFGSIYLTSKINLVLMLLKNTDLNKIIIKRTITISPNASLLDAREVLLRHNLKRLVVTDSKKRPVGIITEKDIAKTIYALGDKPIKSVKVSGFMSKKLITAMPGDSLLYVESLLIHNRIARIVIQRNRIPVGIITYRDFVPAKLPYWLAQSADPKEVDNYKMKSNLDEFQVNQMNHLLHFKAVDFLSSSPITVEANEDVGVAVLLMIRNGISGLPVVKKSKLVGIITKTDIVNTIAEA